jgi:hypothetical protein
VSEKIRFKTVCAHCGVLKKDSWIPRPLNFKGDVMISHGICKSCTKKILKELKEKGGER